MASVHQNATRRGGWRSLPMLLLLIGCSLVMQMAPVDAQTRGPQQQQHTIRKTDETTSHEYDPADTYQPAYYSSTTKTLKKNLLQDTFQMARSFFSPLSKQILLLTGDEEPPLDESDAILDELEDGHTSTSDRNLKRSRGTRNQAKRSTRRGRTTTDVSASSFLSSYLNKQNKRTDVGDSHDQSTYDQDQDLVNPHGEDKAKIWQGTSLTTNSAGSNSGTVGSYRCQLPLETLSCMAITSTAVATTADGVLILPYTHEWCIDTMVYDCPLYEQETHMPFAPPVFSFALASPPTSSSSKNPNGMTKVTVVLPHGHASCTTRCPIPGEEMGGTKPFFFSPTQDVTSFLIPPNNSITDMILLPKTHKDCQVTRFVCPVGTEEAASSGMMYCIGGVPKAHCTRTTTSFGRGGSRELLSSDAGCHGVVGLVSWGACPCLDCSNRGPHSIFILPASHALCVGQEEEDEPAFSFVHDIASITDPSSSTSDDSKAAYDSPTDVLAEVITEPPTNVPDDVETEGPTHLSTDGPTPSPTLGATDGPTTSPIDVMTAIPTSVTTDGLTDGDSPTEVPTDVPTDVDVPTTGVTDEDDSPTEVPTDVPTDIPIELRRK